MAVRDVSSGVVCVLLALFSQVMQITSVICFCLKYTYFRQNYAM